MLVKAKEMMKRVSGFSIPLGWGVQWEPPARDRDTVRKLLAFLEDRRVLFNPYQNEFEDQVNASILTIREHCTEAVGQMSEKAPAVSSVRAIGAACRRFLDEPRPSFDDIADGRRVPPMFWERHYHGLRPGSDPAAFFTALGEFRAFVGTQIAILAATYEVDVQGELARFLPPSLEGLE